MGRWQRMVWVTIVSVAWLSLVPVQQADAKKKGSAKAAPAAKAKPVDPAQMEQAFDSFCAGWMDKLRAREKQNLEKISWEKRAEGVVGEYVGYDTDHTKKVETEGRKVPIGRVVYKEYRLRLTGKSEAEALSQKPEIVEAIEVTELFRFDRGIWVY